MDAHSSNKENIPAQKGQEAPVGRPTPKEFETSTSGPKPYVKPPSKEVVAGITGVPQILLADPTEKFNFRLRLAMTEAFPNPDEWQDLFDHLRANIDFTQISPLIDVGSGSTKHTPPQDASPKGNPASSTDVIAEGTQPTAVAPYPLQTRDIADAITERLSGIIRMPELIETVRAIVKVAHDNGYLDRLVVAVVRKIAQVEADVIGSPDQWVDMLLPIARTRKPYTAPDAFVDFLSGVFAYLFDRRQRYYNRDYFLTLVGLIDLTDRTKAPKALSLGLTLAGKLLLDISNTAKKDDILEWGFIIRSCGNSGATCVSSLIRADDGVTSLTTWQSVARAHELMQRLILISIMTRLCTDPPSLAPGAHEHIVSTFRQFGIRITDMDIPAVATIMTRLNAAPSTWAAVYWNAFGIERPSTLPGATPFIGEKFLLLIELVGSLSRAIELADTDQDHDDVVSGLFNAALSIRRISRGGNEGLNFVRGTLNFIGFAYALLHADSVARAFDTNHGESCLVNGFGAYSDLPAATRGDFDPWLRQLGELCRGLDSNIGRGRLESSWRDIFGDNIPLTGLADASVERLIDATLQLLNIALRHLKLVDANDALTADAFGENFASTFAPWFNLLYASIAKEEQNTHTEALASLIEAFLHLSRTPIELTLGRLVLGDGDQPKSSEMKHASPLPPLDAVIATVIENIGEDPVPWPILAPRRLGEFLAESDRFEWLLGSTAANLQA